MHTRTLSVCLSFSTAKILLRVLTQADDCWCSSIARPNREAVYFNFSCKLLEDAILNHLLYQLGLYIIDVWHKEIALLVFPYQQLLALFVSCSTSICIPNEIFVKLWWLDKFNHVVTNDVSIFWAKSEHHYQSSQFPSQTHITISVITPLPAPSLSRLRPCSIISIDLIIYRSSPFLSYAFLNLPPPTPHWWWASILAAVPSPGYRVRMLAKQPTSMTSATPISPSKGEARHSSSSVEMMRFPTCHSTIPATATVMPIVRMPMALVTASKIVCTRYMRSADGRW